MCDFKPGDEVVCVDASPSADGVTAPIAEGEVYTVSVVRRARMSNSSRVVIELAEVPPVLWHDGLPRGYKPSRFRKVERRKTDLSIESFLTIKPGFEEPRRPKAPAKKERA